MTTKKWERLDKFETLRFRGGHCPDCGSKLQDGPSGGGSQNVYCANYMSCGSRFNDTGPFGVDRITEASPERRNKPSPSWPPPLMTSWERIIKED